MSLYTLMQSSLGTTNCNGNSPSLSVEDERNTNNYCCDAHSSTGMLYAQFEIETLCQPRKSPQKGCSLSLRNGDSDVFSAQSQTSSLYESFLETHPVDEKDTEGSVQERSKVLQCSSKISKRKRRSSGALTTVKCQKLQTHYDSSDDDSSGLDSEQDRVVNELLKDAAPDGTIRQDKSHWKSWCRACDEAKVSPWRIKELKTEKQRRKERRTMAYVTWLINRNMKPRTKADRWAKPSSSYQVYLGAKRVHKRQGYAMVNGELVVLAMKAITKKFIKKHGFKPLVKKRREPFTRSMIKGFMRRDWKVGTKLGPVKVSPKSKGYQSWRCLNAAAAQAGFRKDEVSAKTKKGGFTKTQFARSMLCFCIYGEYFADPTPEQLRSMIGSTSCSVLLTPHPSKADQTGEFWCDRPIYFPIRPSDPVCAAVEFINLELLDPCRGEDRISRPLFMNDKGEPFTGQQVDAGLRDMLKLNCPEVQHKKFSFHSYRIWLACALDNVNCPPSKIKRILRWISDESLSTYCRENAEMYSAWLDRAATAEVNPVQTCHLPSVEAILQYVDCPEQMESDYEDDDE